MAGRFERREPSVRLVDIETGRSRRISHANLVPEQPIEEGDFPPDHVVAQRLKALHILDGVVDDPTTTLFDRAKMAIVKDRLGASYD